ncbi:UvrD-helicase domain-containing protein [Ornithinimicrobium pratense]|uniref:UvrD-helicase domain-containing protein n=1 Tax=Ornithinimicrobium pratense TaxID=2593973 RepID=UPI003B518AC7
MSGRGPRSRARRRRDSRTAASAAARSQRRAHPRSEPKARPPAHRWCPPVDQHHPPLHRRPSRSCQAVGDPHQSIYGWRGASATTLTLRARSRALRSPRFVFCAPTHHPSPPPQGVWLIPPDQPLSLHTGHDH